ncbi:NAD-dependent epimerase/dehydratase family protein [Deinococcus oregonensis]|uniref:NAD-dependent epimerase/dehydratase family protein n=1 Tax=Deinococcus oregonensis TaxID=1805970 RepID=A0ABV6AYR6_9DEIO
MMGRLLVTGGAGFIGSHIIDTALEAGWEVAALDNLSTGSRDNLPGDVPLYEVDLRHPEAVHAAVADFRPTVISHQAAQASVSVSVRQPVLDADINILGGLNLLMAAHHYGTERVIFASTGGAIYGEVDAGRADESAPVRPYSPYATSKLAFEYYLQTFYQQWGLEFTVLRYANVYGPRQNPHGEAGVVAIFTARLQAGLPLQINAREEPGDDGCVRDYVYVGDVARANLRAATGQIPRLMNVGTGAETTTRQLAQQLAATLGRPAELEFGPHRSGDLKRSVLDPGMSRAALGEPLDLTAGLQHLANWLEART